MRASNSFSARGGGRKEWSFLAGAAKQALVGSNKAINLAPLAFALGLSLELAPKREAHEEWEELFSTLAF